ncbi:MFS transporter [Chloroflexota bacterium]
MNPDLQRFKVYYGWYIVGACAFILLYTHGVVSYGFTAIFEPIAEEIGWSYARISLAASLRGLEVGLFAPLMGFLVDRWGSRRLVFGGSILICLGLLLHLPGTNQLLMIKLLPMSVSTTIVNFQPQI